MPANLEELVNSLKTAAMPTVAVAIAQDQSSLWAIKEAERRKVAHGILIGDRDSILKAAAAVGFEPNPDRIIHEPDHLAAATTAVRLVNEGQASVLMKGLLHTDILLHPVLDKSAGLRTGRLLSHVFAMEISTYPRLLLITDAAFNIAPTLEQKKEICQNAIDLALKIGIAQPKVAVLAAVEEVNDKMACTVDAAALAKMSDRRQIKGGIVDGPLAFDNAISPKAAEEKGIVSPVAGVADIVLVPDIESGNILFKCLAKLCNADGAGVVVGARAPIVLTSRADSQESKFYSLVLGAALARPT